MTSIKDIKTTKSLCLADNQDNFLTDRVEKLSMAIYLVTDLLLDTEPIKFKLRDKNIELMSVITDKQKSIAVISEIDSLLKVAFMAKLISQMNYTILNVEYGKLLNLAKGNRQVILSDKLFEDSKGQKSYKGHSIKDIYKGQNKKEMSFTKSIKDKKPVLSKKRSIKNNPRRESILNFIKDKKEVNIKDIFENLQSTRMACSKKTLQRELTSLVEENVLKREGEKRWTKYLLNS